MIKFRSAEVLCVGTEILIGDIINTNAAFISSRLAALGINQYYQSVVGDNPDRLRRCIENALGRSDLLIMTGGLGPTYDDLTKETAARVMRRTLVLHERSFERLKFYFSNRGVVMSENNIKQAMMPEGSVVFDNNNGTAPGLSIEDEEAGKAIIMLPGPPREMIPMWNESVEPYLKSHSDLVLVSRNINLIGIGESSVEAVLAPLMKAAENPTVAPYCKEGEVRLRVTARVSDENEGYKLCEDMIEKIRESEIGKYIYGIDTDLPTVLIERLRKKGLKITTAESCTGGRVAEMLTNIPGCSDVFDGGVVSYANRIKEQLLGVSHDTLEKRGAVSEQTAREMAVGALALTDADIAIAITGIAGPGGGSKEKPVGLVYIALAYRGEIEVRECHFIGSRDKIRQHSAMTALTMAEQKLRFEDR